MVLNPQFIEKNGIKEFIILPIEEFENMKQFVEDYEDLIDLRNAKEEDKGKIGIGIDDLIFELERQIEN